jgi:hypothetical protein
MNVTDTNKILATAFAPETRITDLLASLKSVKAALAEKIDSVRPARKALKEANEALDAAILLRCPEEHAAVEAAKAEVKLAGPDGYHYLETCRDAIRAALKARGHKGTD